MGKNKSNKHKNIVIFKDGWLNYHIKITDDGLVCPCSNNILCNHIKKLLLERNIGKTIMSFYCKFRSIISKNYNEENFITIVNDKLKNILSENCAFCCSDLSEDPKNIGWVMCCKCNKLSHSKCHEKWASKHKDCMYCRHDPTLLI